MVAAINTINLVTTEREREVDLFALFGLLWKSKALIAGITVLAVGGAAAYAFLATPTYKADVVVTEVTDRNSGGLGAVANQLGGLAGAVGLNLGGSSGASRQATAVLQSRKLVEEFIKRNNLVPVLYPHEKKQPTLWYAVRKFQRSVLDIKEDTRKGTMTVSIEWIDPEISANWANSFVALANDMVRSRVLAESNRDVVYLNEQLKHTSDVQLQRVMYDLIEQETKTLMIAYERPEFAFTVVDPAVGPEIKTSPRRLIIIALAFVLGLIVGSGAALLRYRMARRRLSAPNGVPS